MTVKGNKKRAEKLLREKLREYEAPEKLVKSDIRFSDAVREWLVAPAMRVDAVTLQGYEAIARVHILTRKLAMAKKLANQLLT